MSLFAGEVEKNGSVLKDIFIEKTSGDKQKWQVIKAKSGEVIKDNEDKWGWQTLG